MKYYNAHVIISTGTVVLQATILTAAAVVGLTLFTFWAVKRGYDFSFTFPFLFTSLLVLLVYITIQVRPSSFLFLSIDPCSPVSHMFGSQSNIDPLQICFPLGRVAMTIYGFLATLVFSGFIVYDTHMLLKHHTYNEYVVAAISRYLDVINLFMAQMSLSCQ